MNSPADKPDLTLCMIVRDERDMLPDLLASVAGLWDELVVADTGSRDETIALLEDAGARIIRHRWNDDFAAARNASLTAATGRWILCLDADERMTPALAREIRLVVKDEMAGAATLVMRNDLPDGHRREARLLRLFRNDPGIRFRHLIHEDVADDVDAYLQQTGLALRHLRGTVLHLGYVREVAASRDKKNRDLTLLRRTLREDPTDFYCWYKILELARFWDDSDLWQQTARQAVALLEKPSAAAAAHLKTQPWSGELAALLSQGLFQDPDAALAWLDEMAPSICPSAPWHLRRGLLFEEAGDHGTAATEFTRCLASPYSYSSQLVTVRPLLGLCRLAATEGNLPRALELACEAADHGPRDPEALLALVTFGTAVQGTRGLAKLCLAHVQAHPDATVPLGRTLLGVGNIDLCGKVLGSVGTDDPHIALGLMVCALVRGEDLDLEIQVDQVTADQSLRDWVTCLWRCGDTQLMTSFADHFPAVVDVFPWLPGFLQEETRRLAGGS